VRESGSVNAGFFFVRRTVAGAAQFQGRNTGPSCFPFNCAGMNIRHGHQRVAL